MAETLAELFERERSDTVHHRGRIVKAVVRLPVRDGALVTIRRLQATDARPQGLKIAVEHGVLDVNGHRAPSIVLWSTTSPAEVTLVVRGEDVTSLELWNCWSLGGVDSAWIGNAGIVTRAVGTGVVLRCSDGVGEADYSDLEVEILVERP